MHRLAVFLIVSMICVVFNIADFAFAGAGDIITVAGGGVGDGNVTGSSVNYPSGVAVDGAGSIYIADQSNHRIRKVDGATGVISTVAGNGIGGFAGDGGVATGSRLNEPAGVALDNAGNLFIADLSNHRIRKVNIATGAISTVAGNGTGDYSGDGGAATEVSLFEPAGLALDSAGNIFIADQSNHRIRKVDVATGVITTVAGNGIGAYSGDGGAATGASLNYPGGVVLDSAGNIYIADVWNHRIRKVDGATGLISTFAGNGIENYSGDGNAATTASLNYPAGVALDNAGNLFIADQSNKRIRKVDGATGVITTVAGDGGYYYVEDGVPATETSLSYPAGVALDSFGNIYIADQWSLRIRKVDSITGVITTIAGNGSSQYSGDGGAATNAGMYRPVAATLDGAGNLYIADNYNNRIRRVDGTTGVIITVAGNNSSGSFPGGYSGDDGAATEARLNRPAGVALDNAGHIYLADQSNHRIRKVNGATGIITTVAGTGTSGYSGDGAAATGANLSYPAGIACDSAGNVYIADRENNRIRKINNANGVITTVAGFSSYFWGFSGDGGPATEAGLNRPVGIALDSAGNLYIADRENNRIRKVDSVTGIITTIAGNGTYGYSGDGGAATEASLGWPAGIALDSDGHLYIADEANHRIRKVDGATGLITTFAGNGIADYSGDGGAAAEGSLNSPADVTLDGAGNIFIADSLNNRIRKVLGPSSPTIDISAPSTTITKSNSVTYTITYSGADNVTLTNSHITLNKTGTANGTISVSGTGTTTRIVTISGVTGDGTLGINVASGSASYLTDYLSAATGPSAAFTVDNIAPTLSISAPSSTLPTIVTYTITYTGADLVTLINADITLNKTGTANGMVTVSGTGTGIRTVTISGITGEGSLGISIAAGSASDLAGNTADERGPSLTWNLASPTCFIKIGEKYFCTIGDMLSVSPIGTLIQLRAMEFAETVDFNYPASINLVGGYDTTFTSNAAGVTTIKGSLTISAGTVTFEKIIIW